MSAHTHKHRCSCTCRKSPYMSGQWSTCMPTPSLHVFAHTLMGRRNVLSTFYYTSQIEEDHSGGGKGRLWGKTRNETQRSRPVSINWSIRNGIWTDRQTPGACQQPKCPKGLWFSGWWLSSSGFIWVSVLRPSIQESLEAWHLPDFHGWSIKVKSISFLHPLSFSCLEGLSLSLWHRVYLESGLGVLGWGYLCSYQEWWFKKRHRDKGSDNMGKRNVLCRFY